MLIDCLHHPLFHDASWGWAIALSMKDSTNIAMNAVIQLTGYTYPCSKSS